MCIEWACEFAANSKRVQNFDHCDWNCPNLEFSIIYKFIKVKFSILYNITARLVGTTSVIWLDSEPTLHWSQYNENKLIPIKSTFKGPT